ncbi:MAG: hypothetical protein ACYTFW_12555 [Planctomycetota bacterium]|jgi:hypothetical protein
MSEDEELLMPELNEMDTVYKKMKCLWCLSEPEWECYIVPGGSSISTPECPICENDMLGTIRADLGKTLISKNEWNCDGFVAARAFTSVTKENPLLCQWCNWFDDIKLCKHPDDPKKLARDISKRPSWLKLRKPKKRSSKPHE